MADRHRRPRTGAALSIWKDLILRSCLTMEGFEWIQRLGDSQNSLIYVWERQTHCREAAGYEVPEETRNVNNCNLVKQTAHLATPIFSTQDPTVPTESTFDLCLVLESLLLQGRVSEVFMLLLNFLKIAMVCVHTAFYDFLFVLWGPWFPCHAIKAWGSHTNR